MQGRIVQINRQLRILRIEGRDGVRYVGDKKALEGVDLDQLSEGDPIQFIPAENKKGEPRVRRIGEDRFESVALPEPPNYCDGPHQFRNPYSFVRTIKPLPEKENEFKKAFVPHDRCQGLSGTITCRLRTLTPFFTPDARTIVEDERPGSETKGHKWMDYSSTENPSDKPRLPFIPGSTLRGVIRSVFEAATNSTFSAISFERLDSRSLPGEIRGAGRVVKLPDHGEPGEIQKLSFVRVPFDVLDQAGDWAKDGSEAGAEIITDSNNQPMVTALHQTKPDGNGLKHGYLKLTGRNVIANDQGESVKRNERFFYETTKRSLKFSLDEAQGYNQLIRAQIARARQQRDSSENAVVAETILERYKEPNDRLREGHLVYFREVNGAALDLGYVAIPRRRYQHRVVDLLDTAFHPSSDTGQLCPASRVFGFVREGKLERAGSPTQSSYASRVFFSDAKFTGEKVKYADEITLEILSSPKPTSCEFYLTNPENPTDVWVYATPAHHRNYNDNAMMTLRGRKFYWHQEDRGQYRWQEREGMTKQNSQNATVRLLAAGNEFRFTIHFENLEAHELGALLWSIALSDNMAHKMGMGKPIGLGSVSVTVEEVKTVDRTTRYGRLFSAAGDSFERGQEVRSDWNEQYLTKFQEWMQECFGMQFEALPNIADLAALLRFPPDNRLTTHYPLMENSNTKNFEWFMENRNPDNIKQHRSQILPFAVRVDGVPDHLKRWRRRD